MTKNKKQSCIRQQKNEWTKIASIKRTSLNYRNSLDQ